MFGKSENKTKTEEAKEFRKLKKISWNIAPKELKSLVRWLGLKLFDSRSSISLKIRFQNLIRFNIIRTNIQLMQLKPSLPIELNKISFRWMIVAIASYFTVKWIHISTFNLFLLKSLMKRALSLKFNESKGIIFKNVVWWSMNPKSLCVEIFHRYATA